MAITPLPTPPSRNDPANFSTRADAFLGALPTFATEANALAVEVDGYADAADASADAAAASVVAALGHANAAAASAVAADASADAAAASAASAANAPGTTATSTSSLAIGTGSKTFSIQTGKNFVVGQFVVAASAAGPSNYMHGQITAHDSGAGSLTVNVTFVSGSGTYADWSIALSAPGAGNVTLDGAQLLTNKTIREMVQVVGTNTNAAASTVYVLTASLTLTLPATPTAGDWVKVQNSSGTTTAVIARNGSNIMSLAENMTIDKGDGASFTLVYADATRGWVIAL